MITDSKRTVESRSPISAPMVAGLGLGVALLTYVGLNLVAPFTQPDEQLPPLAQPEDIFAGDVASAPIPRTASSPSVTAAKSTAVASAAPEANVRQAKTEPAPAAASAAKRAALSPTKTGSAPGNIDKPAPSPPIPATTTKATAPRPQQPASVPTPSPRPAPTRPAPTPPAAIVAATTQPTAARNPPNPVSTQSSADKPKPPPPATSHTITAATAETPVQWWPKTASSGRLNLLYAGQAATERTVALLFDSTFAASAVLTPGLKLLDETGSGVAGRWEINANRRMLLFRNLKPGRYTVLLPAQLANDAGLKLGSELHGPIVVR